MNTKRHDRSSSETQAFVARAQESLVTAEVTSGAVMMSEVGYVIVGETRLKAEVIRIRGRMADMQVYEDTTGVRVGDRVEMTGKMLSIELGPGLLGNVFDGLQNPLALMAQRDGFFLQRGRDIAALDTQKRWEFLPVRRIGEQVRASDVLGIAREGRFEHKVTVPFDFAGEGTITSIGSGSYTVDEPVCMLENAAGENSPVSMLRRWPIRKPMPGGLMKAGICTRRYPDEPMITSQRIIDTFFPVAKGGTACIPGPFGAGKTVLQSLIARHAAVDIVIIVACGERAGEVVETITDYPETVDPRTGGALMERTVIICNTSSMPVAARESSLYTGITIGEYYRQMGLDVLLIADSTSRWAQAMREISGRLEEIPGEEAFPAYLESAIKQVYERGGVIEAADGARGSLTLIGTVSPAGGNFEEPVTLGTLSTVKSFLGLSAERAYRRYYPAIDPLLSWSRYLDQLSGWYGTHFGADWVESVKAVGALLERGESIYQMMKVTGEEGITLEDYVTWQKAVLADMVYLQQDAFDAIDAAVDSERQLASFRLLKSIVDKHYRFASRQEAQAFFTELTGYYRNLNYSQPGSTAFSGYQGKIAELVACYESL